MFTKRTGKNINCATCNKKFYVAPYEIKANRLCCSWKCMILWKKGRPNLKNTAENNSNWKGDNVGLESLHAWITRRIKKPSKCGECDLSKKLDLANISQEYKRDLSDWEWLCRKCHMNKDGRIKKLVDQKKCLGCIKKAIPGLDFCHLCLKGLLKIQADFIESCNKVQVDEFINNYGKMLQGEK